MAAQASLALFPADRRHPRVTIAPLESARAAGLRHRGDDRPGIRRRGSGKGFRYLHPGGEVVRDDRTLRRIRALVIPPAWTGVWISPDEDSHIQATGRDAKGRKQYRYHPRFRALREETKYERMPAFAAALPRIRARVAADLSLPGLPRDKVLATLVRLLETTLIRVGNEEYARKNHSFGLTTLRDRHVKLEGNRVQFRFRGKSGKEHAIDVRDRHLASIVHRMAELPGHELFQYVDHDGRPHSVESGDVNGYLRAVSGLPFTAKDFRTWGGTVLAAVALREIERPAAEQEDGAKDAFRGVRRRRAHARRQILAAIKAVAGKLGNTPAVCRKCYVHPAVLDGFLDGDVISVTTHTGRAGAPGTLKAEERALVAFLRRRASP
ncbi:MAG TPA: DNA topoisomerase IB [Polyangiaceae bacterium]|jgi:DNA topoisomerase-1